jgi:hypothetical protein
MALFTTPYPQFLDANGDPIVNGYVYFGMANTDPVTNPKSIYDLDGNILTNPQRTNSLGQCSVPIDLTDSYSISLRNSSNVQLWACPEFTGIGSGGGGSTTNYWEAVTDSGSGTTVIRIKATTSTAAVLNYPQVLLGTNTSNIPLFLNAGGSVWTFNPALQVPIALSGTNTYTGTLTGLTLTDNYIVLVDFFNTNTLAAATFNGVAIRGRTGATGILPAIGSLVGVQRLQYDSANTCWIALDVKDFDLNTAGSAFSLAVNESAHYSFSGITSGSPKLLYLTTAASQSYQFTLTTSLSVATADNILKINGAYATTTYQQGTVLSAGGGAGSGTLLTTGLGLGHSSVAGVVSTVDCSTGITTSNVTHAYNDGVAYGMVVGKNSQSSTCTAFTDIAPSSGNMSGSLIIKRIN